MDQDFVRCEAEEEYGIPRMWGHRDGPDRVRCWVQKTAYGRWRMHRRISYPRDDHVYYTTSPPFDEQADAIAYAKEWMVDYSKNRRVTQLRLGDASK